MAAPLCGIEKKSPSSARRQCRTTMRATAIRSIIACYFLGVSTAFQQPHHPSSSERPCATPRAPPSNGDRPRATGSTTTSLRDMKRPFLDGLATFFFKLETDRVASSSVPDDKGRTGEPMEWAEESSIANRFSALVSSSDVGYGFKQAVADVVAGGGYDREAVSDSIRTFVAGSPVAMYSFTTCPFCRKAKDYLEEMSIPYVSIELDLLPGNEGNEIRAELGRMTRRTSVPSIFIGGEWFLGECDPPFPPVWLLLFQCPHHCLSFVVRLCVQESILVDATTDRDCYHYLGKINSMVC